MSDPVVNAIYDLARVVIALQGDFKSKAEVIRRLDELSIPTGRIAAILSMDPKDVASSLAKARKKQAKKDIGPDGRRSTTDPEGGENGEG